MSLRLLSFLSVFTLLMNACTFSKKTPDEVKADAFDEVTKKLSMDEGTASIGLEDLEYHFEPLPEPNEYKLIVKISKVVPFASLEVDAKDSETVKNASKIETFLKKENNAAFKITVKTYNSQKTIVSTVSLGNIVMPVDLIIDKDIHLSDSVVSRRGLKFVRESIRANRIFFYNDATIYTYGSQFSMVAEQIISRGNSKITLFPRAYDHEWLSRSRDFKEAPSITIKSKKAIGQFKVYLIGVPGLRGQNAQSTYKDEYTWLKMSERLNGKDGQDAKIRSVVVNHGRSLDGPSTDERFICERQPTNGENGRDATPVHGHDGGPGLDVGDLVIDIEDYQETKFTIVHRGGDGGSGGQAMLFDLPGGKGGKAGKSFKPCGTAQDGRDGNPALAIHSQPGVDGPSGIKGQTIVPQSPYHFQYE